MRLELQSEGAGHRAPSLRRSFPLNPGLGSEWADPPRATAQLDRRLPSNRHLEPAFTKWSPGSATVRDIVLHAAGRPIDVATGSHLLTATADARCWLLPRRGGSRGRFLPVSGVFGGQLAYKDLFESSTVSGIVGTMMHYQMGRVVGFRLRVQDRLYRLRFGGHLASRSKTRTASSACAARLGRSGCWQFFLGLAR